MESRNKKLARTTRYYLLSFLTFLISFIGIIGIKLCIVLLAIGIAFLTDEYFGKLGLTLGYLFGLSIGGLLFICFERTYPYLERLEDYTKSFKRYPYTEKYGKDYPHPKPQDFGITPDEFNDYNKRFQVEFIKLILTYGLALTTCIYIIQGKITGQLAILLIGGTGIIAILLHYFFDYWDNKLSRKHRYYDKIHKFQEALKIYFRIQNEQSIF